MTSTPSGVRSTLTDGDGVRSLRLALPLRAQRIFAVGGLDEPACFIRVTITLEVFGRETDGDLRAGLGSVRVESYATPSTEAGAGAEWVPGPVPYAVMRSVALHQLAVEAVQQSAFKVDDSEVTLVEAQRLLRGRGIRRSVSAAEKLNRASRAYLNAKNSGNETTAAVMRELNYGRDQQSAARHLIHRAVRSGVLQVVAAEMGLTNLLTAKQRSIKPKEQSS